MLAQAAALHLLLSISFKLSAQAATAVTGPIYLVIGGRSLAQASSAGRMVWRLGEGNAEQKSARDNERRSDIIWHTPAALYTLTAVAAPAEEQVAAWVSKV